MTEIEMKLLLARYNILSRERAEAAYMWGYSGKSVCYETKWSKCVDEMRKMKDDLRKHGYEFAYTSSKTADKVQYAVYRIVAIATAD